MTQITLESGAVRNGALHITLSMPEGTRTVSIGFVEETGIRHVTAQWPTDFTAISGETRQITFPLPDVPFSELQVTSKGLTVTEGPNWHLKGLYAFSEAQFEKHLYRHRNRVKDPETLVFSTRQILDHYRLNPAHRCISVVIYAYRAADKCEPSLLQDARHRLLAELENTAALTVTGEARTDRDHLHLSMCMALWHVELALGLHGEMIATLDRAVAYAGGLPNPMAAIAYNMCRMFLLRGFLYFKARDFAAAEWTFMQNFSFYVKSMERAEPSAVRFTEMIQAHQAVALSLQTLEKMKLGRKNTDTLTAFATANRVRSQSAVALLNKQFVQLSKRLSAQATAAA